MLVLWKCNYCWWFLLFWYWRFLLLLCLRKILAGRIYVKVVIVDFWLFFLLCEVLLCYWLMLLYLFCVFVWDLVDIIFCWCLWMMYCLCLWVRLNWWNYYDDRDFLKLFVRFDVGVLFLWNVLLWVWMVLDFDLFYFCFLFFCVWWMVLKFYW